MYRNHPTVVYNFITEPTVTQIFTEAVEQWIHTPLVTCRFDKFLDLYISEFGLSRLHEAISNVGEQRAPRSRSSTHLLRTLKKP